VNPGAHRLRRAQHPRPRVAQPTFQPDTTPPVIVLDLTQGSTLTLGVNASDNVGIMRVQYDMNGELLGSSTAAPFELTSHVSSEKDFIDAAGNVATSTGNLFFVGEPV